MKRVFIGLINIYQKSISKIFSHKNIHCKFYPSCSEYTKQAIVKYGVIKGSIKGFFRILRCNPFSKGGVDPVK